MHGQFDSNTSIPTCSLPVSD